MGVTWIEDHYREKHREAGFVIASNHRYFFVCHYNDRHHYHYIRKDGTLISSPDLDVISETIKKCTNMQTAKKWLQEMSEGFYR